jgi:hypothetical protein
VRWLPECLASVRAQTTPAAGHVLALDAVDLAGLDLAGTRAVRLLWHVGVTAINHAIAAADTDWVVVLNSDDTLRPECLAHLAAHIDAGRARWGAAFYVRFLMLTSTGRVVPSGQCFHRQVWASVGGYPDAREFDVEFVSRILAARRYAVTDCAAPAGEMYYFREHADQWTQAHMERDTLDWVRVYGWTP